MTDVIPNDAASAVDAEPTGKWPWLQTYTGKTFFPGNPRPEDIDIVDIAVGLSRENRYNGHTKQPYSVAQHSVIVSRIVPPEYALWGLLHDASEAYVKDLTYSIKSMLPEYKTIEKRTLRVIVEKYGLDWPEPACVKDADMVALSTEKRDLLGPAPRSWRELPEPLPRRIVAWSAEVSATNFVMRAAELGIAADWRKVPK